MTRHASAPTFSALRAADILAAARRIAPLVERTPLRHSARLSDEAGGDVYLKLESEQVTGSFKARGASNTLALMPEADRARGVVASSAGNHGLGVALAAKHFGVAAVIFVPSTAPMIKRRGIEALGATVNADAPDYDAAMDLAVAHAEKTGATFVHPCLGDPLIAGQGTVALEILEDLPDLGTMIVPIGGAGLLAGTGALLRRVAPDVRILGAQSVHTAAMARSLAAGRVVPIPSEATLADGLAGGIDDFALDVGRHALDGMVTLEEEAIADGIRFLHEAEGVVSEGSGAVGVAALRTGALRVERFPAAIVISGRNIDDARLEDVLGRTGAAAR
jgi:threonine dehydratase